MAKPAGGGALESSCVCACRCGARTAAPALRLREKGRLREGVESGLGSGVFVTEAVSVVVEEHDDYDYQPPAGNSRHRPRLVPSASTFSKKENLVEEEADLELGAVVYKEEDGAEQR
jgi:hypothetical protein